MPGIRSAFLLASAFLAWRADGSPVHIRGDERFNTLQQSTHAAYGAVATDIKTCSDIGGDIMKQGGNAADAMIASCLCVGTIASYHLGIGGGGFMLVRSPNGTYDMIDFRESAPAALNETMYVADISTSLYGGLASGVPGELRGFEALHKKYGQLPWKDIFAPAVKPGREGFIIQDTLASIMHSSGYEFLYEQPTWAIDFAPNGTLLGLNDTMTRKRYADTLETIGKYGADAFYNGPMANVTAKAIQDAGGIMTAADLANYTAVHRDPLHITYRDYDLYSTSAPSSGGIALFARKILEGYNMSGIDNINVTTQRLVEAMKFAYGQRTELGDPNFVYNVSSFETEILQESTAAGLRAMISNTHTLNSTAYDPFSYEILWDHGTSHMVTADNSGLVVSLTTTVNLYFGSQVMVPETGVVMNDEMNDFFSPGSSNAFGYVPTEANFIRPGKRPLSSISPTIAQFKNGTFYVALGAAGGSRIITSNIQNLWHVLDQGMSASKALAEPRLHDQISPNATTFEYSYDNATVAYLASAGHNVTWVAPGQSIAQAVRYTNGMFEAAADPRRLDSGGATW
ncbi:gamma-glutamyltranspeptidase [Saitoella complicata NRRL Y-17804]|uniref:gamma-glutamyltranspeptidase n=1 Tax=Saitoella complicata (strain BCRC 22490 / CBS 7301 / JCM 7358 / NBRC 10748 / NRRL Y-17804) TaxID=698492 RepID=UPI0008672702|nr:gamma-glutamyltranspeptidase [Saitoella complicata NRRL Y-17804]ODQ53923.1 gamma-glutamyltranspeptidase [Saitoella complicata NRRL Y-17804]